jgi:hypothetical protein
LVARLKSKSRDAPLHAEAILERMARLHNSGDLDTKPDRISYSFVINCCAKSGQKDAPDAALKLLRSMIQQYLAGDDSLGQIRLCTKQLSVRLFGLDKLTETREEMLTWEVNNINVLAKHEK